MNREAASRVRYIRYQASQADERRQQRLIEDLGLDGEAVEVIMNLHNQVTTLQARLREIESRLEIYQAGYSSRLKSYRQVYYEADWEDE